MPYPAYLDDEKKTALQQEVSPTAPKTPEAPASFMGEASKAFLRNVPEGATSISYLAGLGQEAVMNAGRSLTDLLPKSKNPYDPFNLHQGTADLYNMEDLANRFEQGQVEGLTKQELEVGQSVANARQKTGVSTDSLDFPNSSPVGKFFEEQHGEFNKALGIDAKEENMAELSPLEQKAVGGIGTLGAFVGGAAAFPTIAKGAKYVGKALKKNIEDVPTFSQAAGGPKLGTLATAGIVGGALVTETEDTAGETVKAAEQNAALGGLVGVVSPAVYRGLKTLVRNTIEATYGRVARSADEIARRQMKEKFGKDLLERLELAANDLKELNKLVSSADQSKFGNQAKRILEDYQEALRKVSLIPPATLAAVRDKTVAEMFKQLTEHHKEARRFLINKAVDLNKRLDSLEDAFVHLFEDKPANPKATKLNKIVDEALRATKPTQMVRESSENFANAIRRNFKKKQDELSKNFDDLQKKGDQFSLLNSADEPGKAQAGTDLVEQHVDPETIQLFEDIRKMDIQKMAIKEPEEMEHLAQNLMRAISEVGNPTAGHLMTVIHRLKQIQRHNWNNDIVIKQDIQRAIDNYEDNFYKSPNIPDKLKNGFRNAQSKWREMVQLYRGRVFDDVFGQRNITDNAYYDTFAKKMFPEGNYNQVAYADAVKAGGQPHAQKAALWHLLRHSLKKGKNIDDPYTISPEALNRVRNQIAPELWQDVTPEGRDLLKQYQHNIAGGIWQHFRDPNLQGAKMVKSITNMSDHSFDELLRATKAFNDGKPGGVAAEVLADQVRLALHKMPVDQRLKTMGSEKFIDRAKQIFVQPDGTPDYDQIGAMYTFANILNQSTRRLALSSSPTATQGVKKLAEAAFSKAESIVGMSFFTTMSMMRQIYFRFVGPGTALLGTYVPRGVQQKIRMETFNDLMKTGFQDKVMLERLLSIGRKLLEGKEQEANVAWGILLSTAIRPQDVDDGAESELQRMLAEKEEEIQQ